MTIALTIACIISTFIVLCILCIIDLRTYLLPNKYVAIFLCLGIAFHSLTRFHFTSPLDMIAGMSAGMLMLLIVRTLANKYYGMDTLGLGDVKLMGAAGLWLGLDHIFLAISLGAFAGLLHGLTYALFQKQKTGTMPKLSQLVIPAGPGFIISILLIGIIKFYTLPALLFVNSSGLL